MIAQDIVWRLCLKEASIAVADINYALNPGEPPAYLSNQAVQCLYDKLLKHSYAVVTSNYIILLQDKSYVEPNGADELKKKVLAGWWVYYVHTVDEHSCLHFLHRYSEKKCAIEKYKTLIAENKFAIMIGNPEEV